MTLSEVMLCDCDMSNLYLMKKKEQCLKQTLHVEYQTSLQSHSLPLGSTLT